MYVTAHTQPRIFQTPAQYYGATRDSLAGHRKKLAQQSQCTERQFLMLLAREHGRLRLAGWDTHPTDQMIAAVIERQFTGSLDEQPSFVCKKGELDVAPRSTHRWSPQLRW
jgi:hypothetical protein